MILCYSGVHLETDLNEAKWGGGEVLLCNRVIPLAVVVSCLLQSSS